jgi:predicted amidohydrolase
VVSFLKIKVSICQIKVTYNKEQNLIKTAKMVKKAAAKSDIVILPEMFNCPYSNHYFPKFAEPYPGKTTKLLANLAKELNIYIVGGSIPEKEGKKIYNTSYSFNRDGDLIGKHRKIHLFDVNIKDGINFKESDMLSCGNKITTFKTEFCKIGVAICYDMRFPELIRKMTMEGSKIIIIPAAFNMTTGPAHWHPIIRARAIDNQIYLIASSPARNTKNEYIAYGHSLIVDPWGKIIVEADEKENIISGIIDLERLYKIRKELPLLKHLRLEIYKK